MLFQEQSYRLMNKKTLNPHTTQHTDHWPVQDMNIYNWPFDAMDHGCHQDDSTNIAEFECHPYINMRLGERFTYLI